MNAPNILPLALGLLIFSFLVTSVFIVPFINLLYHLKFTRRKESQKKGEELLFDKLHDYKAGTPVGGGIILILVLTGLFWVIFPLVEKLGVFVQTAHNLKIELFLIFFTFFSFGLLGFLDDAVKIFAKPRAGKMGSVFGLRGRYKFVVQVVLALVISAILYSKLGIHIVNIPLLDRVVDLGVLYIPFAAFVIVSFSNAFNITDGLDGLASGLLMICLFAFWIITASNLDTPLSIFISLWIGSLVAFLYFNVWKARIFLGDTGALSFGAMLAVIGLLSGTIVALVVIGGLFVLEAASSIIQILGWKLLKRPVFPLAPFHHTLLAIGWEEPKIVMRAWLAGIMLALFGLWLATI